jgi:hypothetical protein
MISVIAFEPHSELLDIKAYASYMARPLASAARVKRDFNYMDHVVWLWWYYYTQAGRTYEATITQYDKGRSHQLLYASSKVQFIIKGLTHATH